MSRRRILLGSLFHETHSFVEEETTLADFTIRKGAELLARRSDGSTIDGFLEVAEAEGWEVLPTIDYGALPAGPVDHAVFQRFLAEFDAGLKAALADGGLDGIWLALHGAMVTTRCCDPEGALLAHIRAVPGCETLPIFAVFDLHANFTASMAQHANALVAYRENPHTDARESAVRSARLLARSLASGELPRMLSCNAPVIWPPTGTGTADRPMRDLEALARQIEQKNPDIWVANVVGGYSFSDVHDAGVSFSVVTTGSDAVADAALDKLVALAVELREFGVSKEWDLDEAILAVKGTPGLHCIIEPADNIGGGGPGDCTPVLRAFLKHKLTNAAIPIADPETVKAFDGAKPGEVRRVRIGGKLSRLDEGPVEIDAKLVSRSDGKFTLEDKHSHGASGGLSQTMGPAVVVTVGDNDGITVLLSSIKVGPYDLAQWHSQGIAIENYNYVGVKAAIAWRQGYQHIMASSHTVVTGGPCTSDCTKLPYQRLRRPIFPLDPIPGV